MYHIPVRLFDSCTAVLLCVLVEWVSCGDNVGDRPPITVVALFKVCTVFARLNIAHGFESHSRQGCLFRLFCVSVDLYVSSGLSTG
jgi:hypothetical protein